MIKARTNTRNSPSHSNKTWIESKILIFSADPRKQRFHGIWSYKKFLPYITFSFCQYFQVHTKLKAYINQLHISHWLGQDRLSAQSQHATYYILWFTIWKIYKSSHIQSTCNQLQKSIVIFTSPKCLWRRVTWVWKLTKYVPIHTTKDITGTF